MEHQETSIRELQHLLERCRERKAVWKGSDLRLAGFDSILQHVPEDLTATVGANSDWISTQASLARAGQMIPLDPPASSKTTVRDVLDWDMFGPLRHSLGRIRDYVLGMRVMLSSGEVITVGGKVVKNVAGFDLAKLFVGARGSLGVILEVTFKLLPLPTSTAFTETVCEIGPDLTTKIEAVRTSRIQPAIFEGHPVPNRPGLIRLVLGFQSTPQAVQWQKSQADELGFNPTNGLDYHEMFWEERKWDECEIVSLRSSNVVQILGAEEFRNGSWIGTIARGTLLTSFRPSSLKTRPLLPLELETKRRFDPTNLFPPLPEVRLVDPKDL